MDGGQADMMTQASISKNILRKRIKDESELTKINNNDQIGNNNNMV